MKVLVVEPSTRLRRLIGDVLQRGGFQDESIVACGDLARVPVLCQAKQPDWVLMDIKSHRAGGAAEIQRMRTAHPDIRVLVLSDCNGPEYETGNEGIHACVLKENIWRLPQIMREPAN